MGMMTTDGCRRTITAIVMAKDFSVRAEKEAEWTPDEAGRPEHSLP
jgi:hypothetical protein